MTVLLSTERLRLRAFRHDDLDALGALFADPVVLRYLRAPLDRLGAFRMAAGALSFLQQHGDPVRPGIWAIERVADGALIGRVGLSAWSDAGGGPRWELGYLLGSRWFGQGYATEAARAVRDHAWTRLGLEALVALVHPDNAASHRVLAKLDFSWDGARTAEEAGQPRQVWTWAAP